MKLVLVVSTVFIFCTIWTQVTSDDKINSYDNLKLKLGLSDKKVPKDLDKILKSIGATIDKPEDEKPTEDFADEYRKQIREAFDMVQTSFSDVNVSEYLLALLDIPLRTLTALNKMAPLSEWLQLFDYYLEKPDLLRDLGRNYRESLLSYYRLFQNDDQLFYLIIEHAQKYLKTLGALSHVVEGLREARPNEKSKKSNKKSKTSKESGKKKEKDLDENDIKKTSFKTEL